MKMTSLKVESCAKLKAHRKYNQQVSKCSITLSGSAEDTVLPRKELAI